MSTLRLTTISNQGGTASVPSETVINGSAKAWVNFNGTGTVAIRRSFNVSSITDNGTADYTVNFTTAMTDANYSAFRHCGDDPGNNGHGFESNGAAYSAGSYRFIGPRATNGALYDSPTNSVVIFS